MIVPLDRLMLDDNELLDDDGVSDRCDCCCVRNASCVNDCGRLASLEEGREELLVRDGNL